MKHDQTNQIVSGLFGYSSQAIFVGLQSGNDFRMLTEALQIRHLVCVWMELNCSQLSSTPFL